MSVYLLSIFFRCYSRQVAHKITDSNSKSKWGSGHPKQVDGNRLLVRLVANKMLPNSIIKSEELKDWLEVIAPEYSIPCLQTFLDKLLPVEYEKVVNTIKGILQSAQHCSITADLWSNRQMRSYLGIRCHLIDDNYQLRSFLLECERFKGGHTAANIASRIENVIDKFHLHTKLDFVITDNAANMVAALDLPAFSGFICEYEDEFGSVDLDVDELGDYSILQHERCFAHSLQLVIKHAFSKCSIPEFLKKV